MWLERIIEAKKTQGITTKAMADKVKLPEDTIARILSGKTKDPRLETVMRLGAAVGLNAWEVFAETGTVVSDKNIAELDAELEKAKAALAAATEELDRLRTELTELKIQNAALSVDLRHSRRELELTEQIVAIHNFYTNKESKQ